jgi:hypothetical protein
VDVLNRNSRVDVLNRYSLGDMLNRNLESLAKDEVECKRLKARE